MEIIESRHGERSTLLCSQYAPGGWHAKLGEGAIADAVIDRLIYNSHTIHIEGKESMRKRTSRLKIYRRGSFALGRPVPICCRFMCQTTCNNHEAGIISIVYRLSLLLWHNKKHLRVGVFCYAKEELRLGSAMPNTKHKNIVALVRPPYFCIGPTPCTSRTPSPLVYV